MPELPEVETARRGVAPHIINQHIDDVVIRTKKLRWPIPAKLKSYLVGQTINQVERRGKYILIGTDNGTLIIHLGMTGSLRISHADAAIEKHDHFDLWLDNNKIMRLRDPRKFGAVLWTHNNPLQHQLLKNLGPEPLTTDFDTDYLYQLSRNRKVAIKSFIMNSHIVVGVGNIYANEALHMAGINPKRMASRISRQRYQLLVEKIKLVLAAAIKEGGTTLRDFVRENGKPGYFQQTLLVYGKAAEPCPQCGQPIKHIRQQQRSSFYCPQCQL